jgi:hypothetical protein
MNVPVPAFVPAGQLAPAEWESGCQRWRRKRCSYRPPGEVFDTHNASVSEIPLWLAKPFVVEHHYAGSIAPTRVFFGLWRKRPFEREELLGVAAFGVPANDHVIPRYFHGLSARDGVELSRLVLLDRAESNAESFFIGACFRSIRRERADIKAVVSYCDPLPRYNEDGEQTKAGHVGTIYRATNGTYRGRSARRALLMTRCGRVISERSLTKIVGGERGQEYAQRQLLEAGAPAREQGETGADYVRRVRASGAFRRIQHPGNHVFTWVLTDGGCERVRKA